MIKTIQINITYKCNLSCYYCFQTDYPLKADRPKQDLLDAVKQLKDFKPFIAQRPYIVIMGGEPFIDKELLYEVIANIPFQDYQLSIISNGQLIDDEDIAKLGEKCTLRISFDCLQKNPKYIIEKYLNMRCNKNAIYVVADLEKLDKDLECIKALNENGIIPMLSVNLYDFDKFHREDVREDFIKFLKSIKYCLNFFPITAPGACESIFIDPHGVHTCKTIEGDCKKYDKAYIREFINTNCKACSLTQKCTCIPKFHKMGKGWCIFRKLIQKFYKEE